MDAVEIRVGSFEPGLMICRSRTSKARIEARLTDLRAQAVIEAGGNYRALVATMTLVGLRVGEATSLRWRDVDLAGGKLRVAEAKTDAGVRVVDVSPGLREELAVHRAGASRTEPDDLVFCTKHGTAFNRNNIRCRAVAKAVQRANVKLAEAGYPPITGTITNHSLRRTFASLL